MKRVFLLTLIVCLTAPAFAQKTCTSQTVGDFIYTNCSDGTSSTTQKIGTTSYTNYSDGSSTTSQHIGDFTYRNDTDGTSSTSQKVGNFTYHNWADGTNGTSQTIGNFTYTNLSDGTSATTQRLGNNSYTNVTIPTSPQLPASTSTPYPSAAQQNYEAGYAAGTVIGAAIGRAIRAKRERKYCQEHPDACQQTTQTLANPYSAQLNDIQASMRNTMTEMRESIVRDPHPEIDTFYWQKVVGNWCEAFPSTPYTDLDGTSKSCR